MEDVFLPYDEVVYTVKVKRIYKGEEFMPADGGSIVRIYTGANVGVCGVELERGERYLLTGESRGYICAVTSVCGSGEGNVQGYS